jgi:hypothetical protein
VASGQQPILNLTGSVASTGALRVSGDSGPTTGGGTAAIANTVGVTVLGTSGQPALLVKFV